MSKNANENTNPLLCDPIIGICGTPGQVSSPALQSDLVDQPVQVLYFTDPICSSCWGIEPQLRKLKIEYGHLLNIDYRMGGLLPDWSYNSGGISQPSDVAHHWDEVSTYYDMPIDGDVWLENPLSSSYPPSIAFKAAQLQDKQLALSFLRELREMVFMRKLNITEWTHLESAAQKVGLDPIQLKNDIDAQAKTLFDNDLRLSKSYGVRGFPTLYFMNDADQKEIVYGSKPYAYYEMAILKLYPEANKREFEKNWETLFSYYPSWTAKEFSEVSGTPRADSEKLLNDLVDQGHLSKFTTKNGSIWTLMKKS